ncbi:MAG: hypothetical protein ACOH1Y_11705 [Propionicimonas sp.]
MQEFLARFTPGEYQRSGAGWDEVEQHPSFHEQNPSNPDRVHGSTWHQFLADVDAHGIKEPVMIDWYNTEELAEGHHRVVAAMHTGRDVPYAYMTPPESLAATLTTESAGGQLFWRVHPNSRPFHPNDATSLEWGSDSGDEPERGYSTLPHPEDLVAYFGPDDRETIRFDAHVIAFTGDIVGEGTDGEPLVIPHHNVPDQSMSWDQLEDLVGTGVVADINRRNGWDVAVPSLCD